MASACLNRISPENLLDRSPAYSSYVWYNATKRISSPAKNCSHPQAVPDPSKTLSDLPEDSDLNEFDGFEFSLDDPVTMLPADELFSDGKLVPLHLSSIRQDVATSTTISPNAVTPDTPYSHRRIDESFAADPYLFSPRAPRCSSRWKELLGFGKLNNNNNNNNANINININININKDDNKSINNRCGATRSIRQFLHRSSKSSIESSVNTPLLKDIDTESVSISSRHSLSSSSSGHDLDDLPRLSLDSDKPTKLNMNTNPSNRPRTRLVKTTTQSIDSRAAARVSRSNARRSTEKTVITDRGLSIDSPRMNSSGKIIFHSLERSSSSPSSLNGGPRFKHRGMERSYSANVRITPVLNVPVCSLSKTGGMFGFPIFSSQQKRDSSCTNAGPNRSQRFNGKSN
ncbi:uncharacterized protein [Rutidosis leptorrhynchoides]|uniref:uncharacterized protein n=1 Tax=Rutidosis leptorrhynchoides TaxID=125765 RepID=UPI003A99A16D